jgi:hypothetical protein
METIRIGHMIGPPALKLRMKKFELAVDSDGGVTFAEPSRAGLVWGTTVAVTAGEVSVAGAAPGAVVVSGAAAGDAPISAGEAASGLLAGGADGACAKAASARVTEHRLTSSVFFIVGRLMVDRKIAGSVGDIVYHKANRGASSKTFQIFSAPVLHAESSMNRIHFYSGM